MGSHIVPHFLLKRIENIDRHKSRNYELGFVIKGLDTKSHFGRSVPTEEIYGDLTEEEIDRNRHPLIVANFFCSNCEDKFARIESEYALTLRKTSAEIYSSSIRSELRFLFGVV